MSSKKLEQEQIATSVRVNLMHDLKAENEVLQARLTDKEIELSEVDREQHKLENELRRMNERYSRMQTRLDQLDRLLTMRTSALCALIELPDPKWVPKKEDMEP